jgi:hypothetical protein
MAIYLQARVYENRQPLKAIEIFAKLASEDAQVSDEQRDFRMLANVSESIANLAQEGK